MNKTSGSKNKRSLIELYDATLDHLKTNYRTQWIETSYGKTHLISAGAEGAAPVLILHGSASNAAGCWPLINGLSAKYRVYAPDIPRQLGKTEPFQLSTKTADYGKWLEEILDQLEVDQIRVVGFSFGGWIACKLGTYIPKRIEKIVLLSPIGLAPFRIQYWMRAPVLFFSMLVLRKETSIGKFATLIAGPTASKKLIEELVVSAKVFLENIHMQAIPYRIKKEDLKELSAPMMLLVGRHDTFCAPAEIVRRVRDFSPTAQTEIIEDAGHVIYFEKPEYINARIIEFLDSNL